MAGASLVDGLAVRVGYCSQTQAKLTVVALWDNGPLTIDVGAGTAAITTPLTGLGNDNPARPGVFPLYYAHITVSGLQPGTITSYVVRKNGLEVAGTLRTLPADGQPFSFLMSTCEHGEQFSPVNVWKAMRDYVEAQEVRPSFYVHVDDLWYADSMRFFGFQPGFGQDSVTGLALTSTTIDPQDTGLSWDYCVSWLGHFGLLPSWTMARNPDRLWWHRNMPLWAQWGDHEVASNWQRGHGGQGNWYGHNESPAYSTDTDFTPVGTTNFFTNVAKANWEALFGQARPGVLRAGGQHWGTTVGPLALSAVDMNTYADGRHNLTTGNGTGCGRKADGTTDLGASGNTGLPYLGSNQIGDILNFHHNAQKPFNIVFTANGIGSHNEPWAQWWVTDFDDFVRRSTTGVLNSPWMNGTSGKLCILKGDSHALHVSSYHADGTAGGLGGSSHTGKELWEICPGTVNGSATASVSFAFRVQGMKLHLIKCGTASRSRHIHGFTHVEVRPEASPQRLDVRLVDTSDGGAFPVWSGRWLANVAGNGFSRITPLRFSA